MKKSLRKTQGAPKSYAEPEEEIDLNHNNEKKEKDLHTHKESIFEHKNWSLKEKVKLMVFFSFYKTLPDWNSQRRSIYLYKHLSNFLKRTRTPEQCKNIHSLLKRKMNTMNQIINAIQTQLQVEENYDKFLTKYEKDITLNFQKQHQLFQNFGQPQYMPLSTRRATERDQHHLKITKAYEAREDFQVYKTEKESREADLRLGPYVKSEEGASLFLKHRKELIENCNFHFKQWFLCTKILEHRKNNQQQ